MLLLLLLWRRLSVTAAATRFNIRFSATATVNPSLLTEQDKNKYKYIWKKEKPITNTGMTRIKKKEIST